MSSRIIAQHNLNIPIMSHNSELIPCVDLQDQLNGYFMSCDTGLIREPVPVIEFGMSSLNTNGVLQNQTSPGSAKRRTIQLIYDQRLEESQVNTNCAENCEGGEKDGELDVMYEVTECANITWSIDLIDLQTHCQADDAYFARSVQKHLDVLVRRIETDAMVKLAALNGKFAVGDLDGPNAGGGAIAGNVKKVTTKFADGKPDTELLEETSYSAMLANYCDKPIIFGWGESWKYFKRLQAGCCADSGIDLRAMLNMFGMAVLGDYRVEAELGVNHFLMVAPGSYQILHYNAFAGPAGIQTLNDDAYKRTVIADPGSGMLFDFSATFDCGLWKFQLKVEWDLVGLPADLFHASDRLNGVTFINEFQIVNP